MQYPVPGFAAHIWFTGRGIALGLPPLPGSTKGHTIEIPTAKLAVGDSAAQRGWLILLRILMERSEAPAPTVGERAAPVQYDVEQLLRSMKATVKGAPKKASPTITLEDIGL